jgi:hypothetical protein
MGRPRKIFTEEQFKESRRVAGRKYYRKSHERFSECGLKTPGGFYVYLWLREDGTPYYVGKGTKNRGFISSAHGVHCPSEIQNILVQEHPSEADAFEAEKFFISYWGRLDQGTGCLRNLTEGGENPPQGLRKGHRNSTGTKQIIAKKIKALWEDPVYRSHMSEAHKGKR